MTQITLFADKLGIASIDVIKLQNNTVTLVEEEAKFLEIDCGPLEELLEEANNIIYRQFIQAQETISKNMGPYKNSDQIHEVTPCLSLFCPSPFSFLFSAHALEISEGVS